jgi:hypothetical protein
MKTEKEYAEMLIEQYAKVTNLVEFGDIYKLAAECAINDVHNTIEALENTHVTLSMDIYNYYNKVLNILKEKV